MYIDRGVVTPGGGATCLASTFNLKSTANTVQYANPTTARHTRLINAGDRLSVVYAGVLTALVGTMAGVVLRPI